MIEFTRAELEILSWALDDHATKLLGWPKSNVRPNLAYLDTMILKHKVDAELEQRRK